MKAPLTPFQLILTVVNIFLFVCCIVGDLIFLLVNPFNLNERTYGVNLCVAVPALIGCMFLVFRTDVVNSFGNQISGKDTSPAVTSLRTYFCMLFFDIAGVLVLMFSGPLILDKAGLVILVFAPAVFVLSAVVYFVRVSRIGLEDFSDDENNEENDGEN